MTTDWTTVARARKPSWARAACAAGLVASVYVAVACGDDSGAGGATPAAGSAASGTGPGGIGGAPGSGAAGGTGGGGVAMTGGTGVTGMPTGGANAGTGGVAADLGDGGLVAPDAGPTGACDNEGDKALIDSGDVDKQSDICGRMCILNGPDCTVMCMTKAIDVSPECALCFAKIVQCSAANCAIMCFADSEGMPCRSCVDAMCTPAFHACSGGGM